MGGSHFPACYLAVVALALGFLTCCNAMARKGEAIPDYQVTDPSADTDSFTKRGDMTFMKTKPATVRGKRNAIFNTTGGLWPGALVPYSISPVFNEVERRVIFQAMKHWEDYTCIRFRQSNTNDKFVMNFITGNAGVCQSFIGRIHEFFQPQGVTLGPGCVFFATVVHEIGHVVGFYHEHSRYDRDQYVDIFTNNLFNQQLLSAFNKLEEGDANTLGYGYDYASVMHYRANTFAQQGKNTIVAKQPGIPLGGDELSPLDIAKANALYKCGPHDTHPPPSITVPDLTIPSPPGISCSSEIEITGAGTYTFPTLPSSGSTQQCALVLHVPEGYEHIFSFPNFPLSSSSGCNREFVQIFDGASTSSNDVIVYFNNAPQGRLCNSGLSQYSLFYSGNIITILLQTDGSITRSGVRVSYGRRDVNECLSSNCQTCTNTPGSFECVCPSGYYHSFAARTCFDVNECAINNGGCEHTCTNLGGGYKCSCEGNLFLQSDAHSCGPSMPPSSPANPTPGTIIPKTQTSPTATPTTTPTTKPTTASPTMPTTKPTTAPPTTPTTKPTTIPPTTSAPTVSPQCNGGLQVRKDGSGSIETVGFNVDPYPINTNCLWRIECPASQKIQITFHNSFRIAGRMPLCIKDTLEIIDCNGNVIHGPFCQLTAPDPITTQCSAAEVSFRAGSMRGVNRTGFRLNYECV